MWRNFLISRLIVVRQAGAPNGQYPRTARGLVGGEDRYVVANTGVSSGPVITAGGHDGGALQTQFHPFIALTLLDGTQAMSAESKRIRGKGTSVGEYQGDRGEGANL